MRKYFILQRGYDKSKGQRTLDDLNRMLSNVGVSFDVHSEDSESFGTTKKLYVNIDEHKLRAATESKAGRPQKYEFNFKEIEKMKADGMSNKDIYTSLGMSKSLFYIRMKECKNNIKPL